MAGARSTKRRTRAIVDALKDRSFNSWRGRTFLAGILQGANKFDVFYRSGRQGPGEGATGMSDAVVGD
jgi:hypothetical protein